MKIDRVDVAHDTSSGHAAKSASAKPGRSFADVHAAAVNASGPATPSEVTKASDEVWTPIRGVTAYAKITSGPRTGQYVDLTRGAHHGDAFTIEQRDGKTVHVFKGADGAEDVLPAAGKSAPKAAHRAADRPAKGETWAAVPGHSGYADILSGKRNGLYVNINGGPREGQAFQLVKRGSSELHIYGEGKDRQVIAVSKQAAAQQSGGAEPQAQAKTP